MPIYEYKATGKGCEYCRDRFEVRQSMDAKPLNRCPKCRAPVKRLVSRFRACIAETLDELTATERRVREFEKEGKWSHAAEFADKAGLGDRAKENYKKAGYDM
jgi:putative FmdB family regulatory protein